MKYCPYCGTELFDTTYGNRWCPNCGKVTIENESIEDTDKDRSYIG